MKQRIQQNPGQENYGDRTPGEVRDSNGYELFSRGAYGEAHTLAHQLFESGELRLGRRLLGEWLAGHAGLSSDWVHLQFHMGVFELALGDWRHAYVRFREEILPISANSQAALTDAPAMLWRLAFNAPETIVLPWQTLRKTAISAMGRTTSAFVQLHNLLSLAGARDTETIKRWMSDFDRVESRKSERDQLVRQFARACIAIASRDYLRASELLQTLVPDLEKIGGSHVQSQLFGQLAEWTGRRRGSSSKSVSYLDAA